MSEPVEIVGFNVRGFPAMLQTSVRHDLLLALQLGAQLYGWQELWKPRYRRALRKLFYGYNHNAPAGNAGTAVSYQQSRFGFLDAGQEVLHARLAGVCSYRRITWVRLFDRLDQDVLVHASAHLVPGAWNPKQRFRKAGRQQRWTEGMERLRTWIEEQASGGRPVVVCVDANAPRAAVVNALGTHIAGQPVRVQSHAPDHVILVGRWEVLEEAEAVHGALSDHAPVTVTARLR